MTNTSEWLGQNSGGDSHPSVRFDTVGATITGTIDAEPKVVETEYGTRLVVDIKAASGTTATTADGPIEAGATVTLWVKPGSMATAVRDAVRAGDASGLQQGATLTVQYERDGERKKASFNPPKLYRAKYVSPVAAVAVDDLF